MECSTLFVVRVWRQTHRGRSAFRASVRAVDAEQEHLFTRPLELARFLDHASRTWPDRGQTKSGLQTTSRNSTLAEN
jgi:hypothetical protein